MTNENLAIKNEIGFIAIGQGGGNIGNLFEEAGHNVLYLNTSKEDLDTLTEAKHTHHIKNGEGCNKDRDKAKMLIMEDFDAILEQIEGKLREEFIFAIFSSGGGTGSGASPMLMELLINHSNKKVGAITILPSRNETLKAYINSYECFRELEDIEGLGATFVLDNNKDDKITINKRFVKAFSAFVEIPSHSDIRGNIDKAEVKELLATRGAAIIAKMDKNKTSTAKLIGQIAGDGRGGVGNGNNQNSSHNNSNAGNIGIFAPIEPDRVIKYIGISMTESIDMDAIFKETGTPLDIYQGSNTKHTVCMLAGLSYPYTFLDSLKQKIEENQENIMRNLGATQTKRLSGDINFLAGLGSISNSRSALSAQSTTALTSASVSLASLASESSELSTPIQAAPVKLDRQTIFDKYKRK